MRNRRGRLFRCKSRGNTGCDNSRYRTVSQIGRESRKATVLGLCPAIFNFHVLAFDIAKFAETGSKRRQERRIGPGKPAAQKPDHRQRRLLRSRRERPRRRAAEQRYELATLHSITSSARASSVGGISKPKTLAVFRLTTNSNLVPCCTGRSAGFAPLRILSTKLAERYHMSLMLAE